MSSNRRLARIVAFQSFYEWSFDKDYLKLHKEQVESFENIDEIIERTLRIHHLEASNIDFAKSLIMTTIDNLESVDEIIAKYAPEWPLDQISTTDLAVLRISITELTILKETPPKATINEAVESSKAFGSDSSPKFVNGVLGSIFREEIEGNNQSHEKEEI